MKYTSPSDWWSIEVPEDWMVDADEDCTTLSANIPLGALQISAYHKDTDPITDEELQEFAQDHVKVGATLGPVSYGDFRGYTVRFSDDECYYREWWFRANQTMVFVTYTVSLADSEREEPTIEEILRTLRAEPNEAST